MPEHRKSVWEERQELGEGADDPVPTGSIVGLTRDDESHPEREFLPEDFVQRNRTVFSAEVWEDWGDQSNYEEEAVELCKDGQSLLDPKLEVQDPHQAIELFERATIIDPRLLVAHLGLGAAEAAAGYLKRAERRLVWLIQLAPSKWMDPQSLWMSYVNLASVKIDQAKVSQGEERLKALQVAASAYRAAEEIDPTDRVLVLAPRAWVAQQLGDRDTGVFLAGRAVACDPPAPDSILAQIVGDLPGLDQLLGETQP